MHAPAPDSRPPDWESFYRDYRKPGYVSGFELTTKLGGGMFGLVFRARKQSIGKDYAIKFLQVDDGEVRRAVLAELEQVKYFAQIDHPNLVSIEDRGEVDGIPYLVMSFAGTETLRDRLPADGALPAGEQKEELLRWFLQACRGIAALHERSLVHFDVKPANVFLKGPVARVGDYGLSKLVTHSRGSLSMGRGTPYYMAPEMLQRRGDHRSDVYSLGVVLYEILCGCVPFRGDSEWEVLRKHETEPPELPSHLTAIERAVLQRCLHKDPAARFQSVHDLIDALAMAAPQEDTFAPRQTPLPAMSAAAAADAPSCLPPGSASSATKPAAKPRPKAKRAGISWGAVAVCVVLAVMCTDIERERHPSQRRTVAAAPRSPARAQVAPAGSLRGRIDQFVAGVQATARSTRKQAVRLRSLDGKAVRLPFDLADHVDLVQRMTDAPVFSPAYAQKLERDGHATFVAAVQALQSFDYSCGDGCRRGGIVHELLAHLTNVEGMRAEPSGCEPEIAETRRFTAYADAWRRFAETFARDVEGYEQVLVAKGRPGRGVSR